MYKSLIRRILFALSEGDAERAHILTLRIAKKMQQVPPLLRLIEWWYEARKNPEPVTVAGITFPNRIGLAAGFDKQGEILPLLQAIGFGFVEVGTILPRPQTGNPRPRMFRIPEQDALCNRMGFNSLGVDEIAPRILAVRDTVRIPIGISLSRNKDTTGDIAEDYVRTLEETKSVADYYAANVSSPNTPGLRELEKKELIGDLVHKVAAAARRQARARNRAAKPVIIKISPDLPDEEAVLSIEAAQEHGASGFILSNTSMTPPLGLSADEIRRRGLSGGFSGPFLFERTLRRIQLARKHTDLPLIACGGITRPQNVKVLQGAGADLFQILTGLVYEGPELVRQLRRAV